MNEKEIRLQQLIEKKDLTNEEVNEAYNLTQELNPNDEEPEELDIDIVRELSVTLQNLRTKRKALEMQAEIQKEKKKIADLEKHLDKSNVWCEECQKFVPKEECD